MVTTGALSATIPILQVGAGSNSTTPKCTQLINLLLLVKAKVVTILDGVWSVLLTLLLNLAS